MNTVKIKISREITGIAYVEIEVSERGGKYDRSTPEDRAKTFIAAAAKAGQPIAWVTEFQDSGEPADRHDLSAERVDPKPECSEPETAQMRAPPTYPNGAPKYAPDGTMLNPNGTRSIFDDVDR